MRALLMSVVIALICASSAVARADDVAAAKSLFDQGVANMQVQDYAAGCPRIAESLRLDRRPGTLYTLATCEYEWGRLATAAARYDEFLRFVETLPDKEKPKQEARAADAREKRAAIEIDVPRWTLTLVPNAPPNTEVKRNGEVIGNAMLGTEMPVDPGTYVLTTQAPGGPVTEKKVEIVKASKNSFVLDVAPVPVPIAKEPPVPQVVVTQNPSMHPRRVAGWALLGTGGVLLGGGLIAGAFAISTKETVDGNCGAAVGALGTPTMCNAQGKAAGESAEQAAMFANIGVIGGAAALVGGIVLMATAPKNSLPTTARLNVTVWPTAAGVMGGVGGTW